MLIHDFEFTISLGKSRFIDSWMKSSPVDHEAYIGKLISETSKDLCLESLFSKRGRFIVSPGSLLLLFTIPEKDFSTDFIITFIFQTVGRRISLSSCNLQDEDYIIQHYDQENNMIAQSFTLYEEVLKIYKIILVIDAPNNLKTLSDFMIRKTLEEM